MRSFLIVAIVIGSTMGTLNAAPMTNLELSKATEINVTLVQNKKDETLKQKVKRVWRNIAGTTYDVGCPSLAIAFTRTTCTETGKDAQAKCIARHPLCQVSARK